MTNRHLGKIQAIQKGSKEKCIWGLPLIQKSLSKTFHKISYAELLLGLMLHVSYTLLKKNWEWHSFTCCPVFPPLTEEVVFSPLYILASFVKDKVLIGA